MRALCPIEKPVQKLKIQFNDIDLVNLLFYSVYPTYTTQPFIDFVDHRLKYTEVIFKVKIHKNQDISYKILPDIVQSIDGTELTDGNAIFNIGTIFNDKLLEIYSQVIIQWRKFVVENMKRICQLEVSQLHWQCFDKGILSILAQPPLEEQKYWIFTNSRLDKDFWIKFSVNMRESFLPFMNHKLWSDIEKRKTNKRDNIDYDKHKEEMYEGTFSQTSDFHIDNKSNKNLPNQVKDSDLDIIK